MENTTLDFLNEFESPEFMSEDMGEGIEAPMLRFQETKINLASKDAEWATKLKNSPEARLVDKVYIQKRKIGPSCKEYLRRDEFLYNTMKGNAQHEVNALRIEVARRMCNEQAGKNGDDPNAAKGVCTARFELENELNDSRPRNTGWLSDMMASYNVERKYKIQGRYEKCINNNWWENKPIEKYNRDEDQFKKEQNFFDFVGRPDYMVDEAYGVDIGGDVKDKPIPDDWKWRKKARWRSEHPADKKS
jgi:hypothetical protein